MSDKKRIAKNTLFLYFRMIFIMLVSIFTSRVVLDKLGVDDFGLYSAVASVIAMQTAMLVAIMMAASASSAAAASSN